MNKTNVRFFALGMLIVTIVTFITLKFIPDIRVQHTDNVRKELQQAQKQIEQLQKQISALEKENQQLQSSTSLTSNKNGQEAQKEQPGKGKSVTLQIQKGMNLEDVAQALEDNQLIMNKTDFRHYMIENGYTHNIQIGDYSLIRGMSFEEIANIITE